MANMKRTAIAGSAPRNVKSGSASSELAPDTHLEVTVVLRRKPSTDRGSALASATNHVLANRKYLTREEHAEKYGADEADIERIRAFAQEHGLVVGAVHRSGRTVALSGSARALGQAFGVGLNVVDTAEGSFHVHSGPVTVPDELAPIVEAVLGFDNRPLASPHVRRFAKSGDGDADGIQVTKFTVPQLAALYNFPENLDGGGQTIAILEFNDSKNSGGFRTDELRKFFTGAGVSVPNVLPVSVLGEKNRPGGATDDEVVLDVEIAGAVAPGSRIVVYFAPNTGRGFVEAIKQAVHDKQFNPSVLSISWGSAEVNSNDAFKQVMESALEDATAMGVTVCVSAGDDGSFDGVDDGLAHADFPGTSPNVLCCGGTTLTASGGSIESEVVWSNGRRGPDGKGSTGGGVSDFFDVPSYQASANIPPSANPGGRIGRGVPDVSAVADPRTGYATLIDGDDSQSSGGTSAVAPFYAGLIALINQQLASQGGKSIGLANPILYANSSAFNNIVSGTNGAYTAGPGWNACTGLGTPNGKAVLNLFASVAQGAA